MPTAVGHSRFASSTSPRAVLLGLTLALVACGDAAPPTPEVRPVRTTVIDPKPMADDRRVVGEIKPRHESELGFRVAGKLVARPVDVGSAVRRGDLLARLDAQDYRDRLKSADADVAAARAVLVEAQAAEGRLNQLLATGTTTRANYDSALKNLRSAEAKLNSATAAFELARSQVAYAELHADVDGIVTAVGAEPGQVVDVGRMVVRVAQPGEKDAVFAIAESAFGAHDAADQHPELVVTLLSNPGVATDGVVREIAPVADPATRTYLVKVTLQDPPDTMRFGASVVGRLKTATAPVVVLPGSALFDQGGRAAVWVVDPASSAVGLKPVAVVRYETDRVIVGGSLAKGDIVVTVGVNRLRENQKVRLADGGLL